MKNIFKFFGIAAIASLMLTACGGDDMFTIKVTANNSDWGTVSGGGKYAMDETVTLTATPKEGYKFVDWNDGNTNNPRIITVTGDAEYVANFAEASGVNVAFGDNNWTAQYVNGTVASQAFMIAACEGPTSTSYPMIVLTYMGAPETGTFTTDGASIDLAQGQATQGNPYIWYYENNSETITLNYTDGSSVQSGGWWNKATTLNVSAFDADAMIMSCIANATMGKAYECISAGTDWANVTTRTLTMNVINQQMAQ